MLPKYIELHENTLNIMKVFFRTTQHRSDVLSGGLPFHHILPLLMNIAYCEVHQNIPNFSLSLFNIF